MTRKSLTVLLMEDRSEEEDFKPTTTNFEEYMPWACAQHQLSYHVVIRVERKQLQGRKADSQAYKAPPVFQKGVNGSNFQVNASYTQTSMFKNDTENLDDMILITAIYDVQDKLEQLKISGSRRKPRKVLQVLFHILPYHPYLTTVIVDPPIDKYTNYEIGNILVRNSNITELILDGCLLKEANFYSLLERDINLRKLSLARCGITDDALQRITSCLIHPTQASKVLSILNLTSNKITDKGAGHIADMLRANTQLYYLSLADNGITDVGANKILDALIEFEISYDERYNYKYRYMEYIKQKVYRDKLLASVPETKQVSKKSKLPKKPYINVQKTICQNSFFSQNEVLDEFTDPFHDCYTIDDKVCSCGNHYLQCLNLAYNKMTYIILDKIVQVLSYQRELNEKPRGLVSINLEGNLLPKDCEEYEKIYEYISDAIKWQSVSKEFKRKAIDFSKVKMKMT